ncbi:MAG: glycoside hydrolase family 3 N-terminal domain-containing protein [Ruthenibacterium sp.]
MRVEDVEATLQSLTTAEKAMLVSGMDAWQTQKIEGKAESIFMADGPHGLRKEDKKHAKQNGGFSVKATCFPPETTLACAWNPELVSAVGKAIAEECKANGVSVLLGPGANIKRSPLCGRNFEYYSEDPLLAGKLGAAMIRGIENEGVGASLKHFAVNNQETLRMSITAEVDPRALHEIYLRPFEIAVKEGKPSTVMCSYNRVNGVYSSENKELLTDILRKDWGFDGLVMSDWGAVSNRLSGLEAGLDLEMPYSGCFDKAIRDAVESGALDETVLNRACRNVLKLIQKTQIESQNAAYDQAQHHALAVKALVQSAVLLKNDGALPLKRQERVAFIGAMAGADGRFQGCGSSIVNAQQKVDFKTAFTAHHVADFIYAPGYSLADDIVDENMESVAVQFARDAEKTVLFVGLTDIYETEGYDRQTLSLPQNQLHLMETLRAVTPHLIIVLTAGSPVEMPWLPQAKALLYLALGGEGFGEGAYQLLYGAASPSGKLADTWPCALADTPCAAHYPMGPCAVTYNESIYVGYRYYDKAAREVLFPFGYGLSYTHFAYSDLRLSAAVLEKDETLSATFTLSNSGSVAADEIVQLYVTHNGSAAHQPLQELKAFARVTLAAGESKEVTLCVPYAEFAFYAPHLSRFAVERGSYTVSIAANSRNRLLTAELQVAGENLAVPPKQSRLGAYGAFTDNTFDDAMFYSLHTRVPQHNEAVQKGAYTMHTTLGEMSASRFAQFVARIAAAIADKHLHFSTNEAVNKKVRACSVRELPFKNVAMNTFGAVNWKMGEAMLDVCNGQAGLKAVVRAWLHRKKER